MTERPNWGWGDRTPVPMFTEDEIRAVMEKHYPDADGSRETWEALCACGPQEVALHECRYCRAPVPPDDYKATRHKAGCKVPGSGYPQMGTTIASTPDFTVDHLIEKLKENRERQLAEQARA